jgi:hypothetical protein
VQRRADRREEDEPFHPRALGRSHQAQRPKRVHLFDRRALALLVADRRGQVHHRLHPAQRMAKGRRVGKVAERDLHPHAVRAEPPRVAHHRADRMAVVGDEPVEERGPDGPGGACDQYHGSAG